MSDNAYLLHEDALGTVLGVELCVFLVVFYRGRRDQQAFAARSVFKLIVQPFMLLMALRVFVLGEFVYQRCRNVLDLSGKTLVVTLSALGLGRVVKIPLIGPWIANFILAQSLHSQLRATCGCLCRRRP